LSKHKQPSSKHKQPLSRRRQRFSKHTSITYLSDDVPRVGAREHRPQPLPLGLLFLIPAWQDHHWPAGLRRRHPEAEPLQRRKPALTTAAPLPKHHRLRRLVPPFADQCTVQHVCVLPLHVRRHALRVNALDQLGAQRVDRSVVGRLQLARIALHHLFYSKIDQQKRLLKESTDF